MLIWINNKNLEKVINKRNNKIEVNIGSILKNLKRGPFDLNIGISRYHNTNNDYITIDP